MSEVQLGVIGAGRISREHLKVIRDIDWMTVLGITSRTRDRADGLAGEFGIPNVYQNIDQLVEECRPDGILVLVSANQIFSVVKDVLRLKVPVFIEKPPGLELGHARCLFNIAQKNAVKNMVGYNRRHYSIFHKGLEVINGRGKLFGIAVEGHERFWKISDSLCDDLRANWIYANSTHTIDLLRFFGGDPSNVHAITKSHREKRGDQIAAVMEFENGTIGHYISHWYSAGGWAVHLYGQEVAATFRPLENGKWIDKNLNETEITPDQVDVIYKPGFYRQMESFGRMILDGKLEWPSIDLRGALLTMSLAEKFSN